MKKLIILLAIFALFGCEKEIYNPYFIYKVKDASQNSVVTYLASSGETESLEITNDWTYCEEPVLIDQSVLKLQLSCSDSLAVLRILFQEDSDNVVQSFGTSDIKLCYFISF